jgi:hypothetical protein
MLTKSTITVENRKKEKGAEGNKKVHTSVSVIEPPLVCLLVLLHRPDGQYLHYSPPPKNSDNGNNNTNNNDNADALVLCAQGKAKTGRRQVRVRERRDSQWLREREGVREGKGGKKRERASAEQTRIV